MPESVAQPVRTLADGVSIPILGLGVWQARNGRETEDAVRWALELGYRHIDTAQAYGNEASVGKALRDSGVPREDVFITTKFVPRHRDPVAALDESLRRLEVDQVDLYIIHWPEGGPTWAWPGMERARESGHTRSIGVSNFSVEETHDLLAVASAKPVVNQVQFSPFGLRAVRIGRRGVQPARHRPTPRRLHGRGDRRAARPDPGANPDPLGDPARHDRHPEVHPP